jgi:RNA polymerase sigma factor (sigma-70 family)
LEKHDRTDPLEEVVMPGVEADEDQIHQRMRLEDLLHRLPAQEARMMRAHLKGYSNQEIAVLLDVSEGRVRNLLSRIRKKLTLMGGS